MTIDELIDVAVERALHREEVMATAAALRLDVGDLLNQFALNAALRYLRGELSYADADFALNNLFAFAHVTARLNLPDVAWQIYTAFDEGEYLRNGEPEDTQGETRTKALLSKIEALRDP